MINPPSHSTIFQIIKSSGLLFTLHIRPTLHRTHTRHTTSRTSMATEPEVAESSMTKDQNRERAKATGDLDKVTDYVEEREMDVTKVAADSMREMLGNTPAAGNDIDPLLMHVKIQQSDVQTMMDELDLDKKEAERALRRAQGDIVKALCNLVD